MNRTFIWAHRGMGFKGTQNCLSSFLNAAEMGADGIKTEAKLSKEDEVIISFYNSLKINGEETPIRELSLKEIKKFKLENNKTIPTLREVFEALENYNIKYNIDIMEPEVGIKIIDTAKEFGLIDRIELGKPSIHPDSLSKFYSKIREYDKNVTLINSVSLKYTEIKDEYLEIEDMRKLNIEGINVNFNFVSFDLFKRVKDLGFKFYVWGVLFKRSMQKLLTMKYNGYYIDAMMSNQPDRLLNFRNNLQN
ncbi:MAG: glycerophosphodiester phosphodiesterase [Candidatus Hermodarchaeota archaeon]